MGDNEPLPIISTMLEAGFVMFVASCIASVIIGMIGVMATSYSIWRVGDRRGSSILALVAFSLTLISSVMSVFFFDPRHVDLRPTLRIIGLMIIIVIYALYISSLIKTLSDNRDRFSPIIKNLLKAGIVFGTIVLIMSSVIVIMNLPNPVRVQPKPDSTSMTL